MKRVLRDPFAVLVDGDLYILIREIVQAKVQGSTDMFLKSRNMLMRV